MTERPIIFSGEMVKEILEGRKSQTRRILRKQPAGHPGNSKNTVFKWTRVETVGPWFHIMSDRPYEPGMFTVQCPYGEVGDRLWVRETWREKPWAKDRHSHPDVRYKADDSGSLNQNSLNAAVLQKLLPKWKSPIFMPRWASRITLEVSEVRVQRLQEISEEDALAEGMTVDPLTKITLQYIGSEYTATSQYRELWQKINGKRAPWQSNPWVWVISFRRVER